MCPFPFPSRSDNTQARATAQAQDRLGRRFGSVAASSESHSVVCYLVGLSHKCLRDSVLPEPCNGDTEGDAN